jgi:hypothetical protein
LYFVFQPNNWASSDEIQREVDGSKMFDDNQTKHQTANLPFVLLQYIVGIPTERVDQIKRIAGGATL